MVTLGLVSQHRPSWILELYCTASSYFTLHPPATLQSFFTTIVKTLMMIFFPHWCNANNPAREGRPSPAVLYSLPCHGSLCLPATPLHPIDLSAVLISGPGPVSGAWEGQRIQCSSFCQRMSPPPSPCQCCQCASLPGPREEGRGWGKASAPLLFSFCSFILH